MMVAIYGVWWGMRELGKMPDSVSELAYFMPHESFGAWVCMVALLMMPPSLECLPDGLTWLAFVMVGGAVLVAASGRCWRRNGLLHYTGGVIAVVCAAVIAFVLCYPVCIGALSCLPVMAARRWRNWCFIGEAAVFLAMAVSLMICFMVG